jgi:hypothetical protein
MQPKMIKRARMNRPAGTLARWGAVMAAATALTAGVTPGAAATASAASHGASTTLTYYGPSPSYSGTGR